MKAGLSGAYRRLHRVQPSLSLRRHSGRRRLPGHGPLVPSCVLGADTTRVARVAAKGLGAIVVPTEART